MNKINNNISFKSRCASIETARSACRKINLFSTTKRLQTIYNLKQKNFEVMEFFENYTSGHFVHFNKNSKIYDVLNAFMNCVNKLSKFRTQKIKNLNFEDAKNLLAYTNKYHLGNCGESAESVSLILKMSGIENTYLTTIKQGDTQINHEICVFNRDGSKFDGNIKNNQTIIIDAWLGVVDFANSALKQIKINLPEHMKLNTSKNIKINQNNIATYNLKKEEINLLKKQYPELSITKKMQ